MTLEKKIFTGGLDTDTENRLLAPNDYRYALNIRSGSAEDADIGAITNVKGNTLISFDLPAGTNKVVGTYEDKKGKRVLYHVYNSNKEHQILEYNYSTNIISLILKSEFLNYSTDFLIWHNNLINDNLFYWADNFGDPHKLNIDRARRLLNRKFNIFGITTSYPSSFDALYPGKAVIQMKPPILSFPYVVGDKIFISLLLTTDSYHNKETTILAIQNKWFVVDLPFVGESSEGTIGTLGYPSPFKKQYLDAIVYPPLCAPTVRYEDDTTVKTNNLRGTLFQFKTQFVYADAEKSAWSPISKLPMPVGEEKFANITHMPETKNNLIEIRLSTGDALATKINIAARTSNTAEGDFFLIDTLEKEKLGISSNNFHVYKFYNDGIYSTIDLKESNKLYDRVPRKAACQEFINGNRLAYMNVLEDYDAVNVDMKITPLYREAFNPSETAQPTITNLGGVFTDFNTWSIIYFDPLPGNLYLLSFSYRAFMNGFPPEMPRNPDNYTLPDQRAAIEALPNLQQFFVSQLFSYSYIAKQGDTKTDIVNSFVKQINDDAALIRTYQFGEHTPNSTQQSKRPLITNKTIRPIQSEIIGSGEIRLKSPNNVSWYQEDPNISSFAFYGENINSNTIKSFTTTPIQRAFKRGARHEFAITYYDFANRSGHANKAEPVYVKSTPETTARGHVDMDVEINHAPPEWATHYQLLYTKNQTTEAFIQGIIDTVTPDTIGNIDILKLSLDHILADYKEDNPNSILSFVPKAGDRIRTISGNFDGVVIDVEILSFDIGTAEITVPLLSSSPFLAGELVEIYSPKKDIKEKFYYEIGECWEIGDAGLSTRYHKGNQNQTSTLPAIIHLVNEGDIYYKQRFIKDPGHTLAGHIIEDFNFSDFYLSAHTNEGRPNVYDRNIKEIRRPNTAYHSGVFIPDSFINGLSSIFGDSFKEYDQNYGSTQRIYTEDKRLICFNELKVGMILVSESVVFDQTGQSTIHKSQEVLSDIIYYAGEYGIGLHPGSFAVYGNRKYFADVNRGAVLRLSQDGITPISEYKMHNHFTDTFKAITTGYLLGVYDVKFGEYILSYPSRAGTKETTGTSGGFFTVSPPLAFTNLIINTSDTSGLEVMQLIELCYFDRLTRKEKCTKHIIASISSSGIRVLFGRTDAISVGDKITFKTIIAAETVAFNERLNRWVTFYSYLPEMMSGAGIDTVTFKDGKLYKHNENVTYNNFYGGQYSSIIEFIANENPSAVKFFLGIEEESNGKWKMPRGSNLNGQVTSLIDEDFEDIEGVFWAALFKDENSIGGLLEGEDMRGHGLSVRLQNDKTTFQKLFSVGVRSELSQRTNV